MKLSIKKIFIIIVLIIFESNGQAFEYSGNCQDNKNVNCSAAQTSYMNKDNIRAVFKFNYLKNDGRRYMCTGTMINQYYDAGGVLRQYLMNNFEISST